MSNYDFLEHQATNLARGIANKLFDTSNNCDDYLCVDTGKLIKISTDYSKASEINSEAMGAHFKAFGYYYVLCFDVTDYEEYVSIHDLEFNVVGTMTGEDTVQVFGCV